MKFLSMELENYRQFYGRQRLSFSGSRDRNVTVVFGANGSGKTTILSGFTWCLYGQMPPGLESPERLVNERAFSEAVDGIPIHARVSLEFTHDGLTYVVQRTQTVRKQNGKRTVDREGGPHDVSVVIKHPNGETDTSVVNPTDKIQQILPVELHRSFFFDGERMEKLVKSSSSNEINAAIKKILGLELIERSIKHLKTAEKQLRKEQTQALPGSIQKEAQEIEQKIDTSTEALEHHRADLEQEKVNLDSLGIELDAVSEALRRNEQSRELQRERDSLHARIDANKLQENAVRERQRNAITRHGFLAFTEPLTQQVAQRVDEVRERGQIPTPIKRQFVEDLLEKGECICGTPLTQGSDCYMHVEEWRMRAVAAGAEESWGRLGAQAKQFDFDREDLFQTLHTCIRDRAILSREYQEILGRLSEIETLLGSASSEEIQDLENNYALLQSRRDTVRGNIGGLERDIARLTQEVQDFEKALREKTVHFGQAQVAATRVDNAKEALNFFEELLAIKTDDTRRALDDKIKEIYRQISYKDYVPELTESFELELHKIVNGTKTPVAKSTGENQILSLSFVGAIAHYARELDEAAKNQALSTFEGGIFPIVMDSPFGALDEGYRKQIADAVPKLGEQIIVLVSKSQGSGVVLEKLRPRLGKRYVIDYQTSKAGAASETIDLDGQLFPYISPSETNSEWAKIREV